MTMSESLTKAAGMSRSQGLAPGDSNQLRHYKWLECLELDGVMSVYDDSMPSWNRWHRNCTNV
jgi:hypothetical protein